MAINEDIVKGKWTEIKGEVKKAWGKLTDDDLEKAKGDMKALGGILQQKYGKKKEEYHKKLSEIVSKFEKKTDESVENVKRKLK